MDVSISEEARQILKEEVESGRYPSEGAVIEDALQRLRGTGKRKQPTTSDGTLDNDPLWGMFRDEPELIDQIVRDAMRDRESIPLRAPDDE